MAEQVVELTPGESKLVSFEAIPTVAKTYSVSVDGLTGSFKAIVPTFAGEISHIWMLHEPLAQWGIVWTKEGPPPSVGPEIPLNGDIYFAPYWRNRSEVSIVGHVDLEVTFPDGTKVSPAATAGQDTEELPGDGHVVEFYSAFIATQEGDYTVKFTLSSAGQVLDSVTFSLAAAAPAAPLFYMPAQMDVKVTNGTVMGMYWTCEFSVVITNQGDAPGTHTIKWWDNCGVVSGSRQITLQPGEDYLWSWSQWIDFRRLPGDYGVSEYIMNLEGDWDQDNLSKGTARP